MCFIEKNEHVYAIALTGNHILPAMKTPNHETEILLSAYSNCSTIKLQDKRSCAE
jgi:hypothetical protein